MSDPPRPELDDLVVVLLQRLERDRTAFVRVLAELCAAHPARAAELVEVVRELLALGLLEESPGGESPRRA